MSDASIVLGPTALNTLALSAIKVDLNRDFVGACMRWGLSRQVAEILKDLTSDEISQLAAQCGGAHVLRLAKGDSPAYWSDLRRAVSKRDGAGIEMTLLSSMLSAPILSVASAG